MPSPTRHAWSWLGGSVRASAWALALGLGFCGTAILASPGRLSGGEALHLPAVLLLMVGCLSWAAGSLYARRVELPSSGWINTAVQMLFGGGVLFALGAAQGELAHFEPAGVSLTSFVAFVYLVIFGSLVAFSAYAWLIRTTDPTLVSTHTYVNPLVALFLGWWLAGETFGPRAFVASALILGSVVLLTLPKKRRWTWDKRRAERCSGSVPTHDRCARFCVRSALRASC